MLLPLLLLCRTFRAGHSVVCLAAASVADGRSAHPRKATQSSASMLATDCLALRLLLETVYSNSSAVTVSTTPVHSSANLL